MGARDSILYRENDVAPRVSDVGVDHGGVFGQFKREALVGQVGLVQAGVVAAEEGPVTVGMNRQHIDRVGDFDGVVQGRCMVAVDLCGMGVGQCGADGEQDEGCGEKGGGKLVHDVGVLGCCCSLTEQTLDNHWAGKLMAISRPW